MTAACIHAAWFEPGPNRFQLAHGEAVWQHTAHQLHQVAGVLQAAQAQAENGLWVVGHVAFDAAPAFDEALAVFNNTPIAHTAPHPQARVPN
ncbi:MAG: hypothetical protein HC848_03290, partial [Limnobacter sp.]|nr:hypothetical protein [Limnobacter sp.]